MTSNDNMNGGDIGRDGADTVARLERFGTTLRSPAVWQDPPDDLADRISASIAELRRGDDRPDVDSTPSAPVAAASLDEARRRRTSWLRPALAVAAAAIAFLAGFLVARDDDGGGTTAEPIADIELTSPATDGAASATGTVVDAGAGFAIRLDVADLPAAPEGEYYEGWVYEESSDEWVSVGTFHMRDGDGRVVLWSGVPIERYRELLVTAETEGPDDGRGQVVLAGELVQRST